jgi:hypothetical protein
VVSREEAIVVARSWLNTPYRLGGRVKGAGCDCGSIIAEYLIEIGRCTREELGDLGYYTHDWFQHTRDERYLLRLIRHAPKILETVCMAKIAAEPGSLALFRSVDGRLYNHGGIVTKWPYLVNATVDGVKESNTLNFWLTAECPVAIFDPWSLLDESR